MNSMFSSPRTERDSLGEVDIPAGAYYGAQTARACINFPISGLTFESYPEVIQTIAMVKKAAARANAEAGIISKGQAAIISDVCDEIIAGRHGHHFPVDVFQGGAGTSVNMNANEVIANRARTLVAERKSADVQIHPNDDVNASQSTNDVFPTSIRLAIFIRNRALVSSVSELADEFDHRSEEFSSIFKLGRTQLQDAVPMTLGQEFGAFSATLKEDVDRLQEIARNFLEINLGGTAIGSKLNAPTGYLRTIIAELSSMSGLDLVQSKNLFEASWDMGAFILYSGMLKRTASKLSKIANDLRLLSSGPRGGFSEITLPPVQAGSSIMPGKVNPVIAEAMNQVCFEVIGNDLAVTMAAEAGQLQLNAFEPLIAHKIMSSQKLLTNAIAIFRSRCVAGIVPRTDNCRLHVDNSTALVTGLATALGYDRAAAIAKEALLTGKTVREVAIGSTQLSLEQIDFLLSVERQALAPQAD